MSNEVNIMSNEVNVPKCPRCGHAEDESFWRAAQMWDDEDAQWVTYCDDCGGQFRITRTITIIYTSTAMDGQIDCASPERGL
jgi:hypothetical protein